MVCILEIEEWRLKCPKLVNIEEQVICNECEFWKEKEELDGNKE